MCECQFAHVLQAILPCDGLRCQGPTCRIVFGTASVGCEFPYAFVIETRTPVWRSVLDTVQYGRPAWVCAQDFLLHEVCHERCSHSESLLQAFRDDGLIGTVHLIPFCLAPGLNTLHRQNPLAPLFLHEIVAAPRAPVRPAQETLDFKTWLTQCKPDEVHWSSEVADWIQAFCRSLLLLYIFSCFHLVFRTFRLQKRSKRVKGCVRVDRSCFKGAPVALAVGIAAYTIPCCAGMHAGNDMMKGQVEGRVTAVDPAQDEVPSNWVDVESPSAIVQPHDPTRD